jgi:FAD/FMN-containing dehydrogenase
MNAELDLSGLGGSLAGDVLAPEDSGYDGARRCYNALIDRRPAVIARCLGAGDITAAFDFARSNSLEVAVRGGGHNPSGHCVCDGGLVIDMMLMREVDVEPEARIAHSQGGATWLDFDAATQAFGMAAPGGIVGSTGVAGLALGGGIGHLTAERGLTCDNLVGAELVTAEGSVIRASDDENPDLLWALRGAGGNFGVATELEFWLEPLDRACYSGDGTPAEIEELRHADGLVSDAVCDHTFLDQQRVVDPPYGAARNYWKGQFVCELPDELMDLLIERIQALDRPPGEILVESLHGAAKEVDGHTAALGWRKAAFSVSAMGVWLDPEADERHIAWARETAAAIEPRSLGGGYVNYMQADEPIERVRAAFGEPTFDRLQELKRRYDPGCSGCGEGRCPPK